VNRNDTRLPSQLRVVGATDLERRLLNAGARELPSVELTRRMQQGLGISLAAGVATAASATAAKAATTAGAGAAPGFAWPAISIGVLALAVTGAVVGVRTTAGQHAPTRAPAVLPVSSPTGTPAAVAAPPAADPVAPAPVAPIAHRGPARRHGAVAVPRGDLRAEIALVDAARSAVAESADDRALALVDRYEASYPRGTFQPEVAALRIEALVQLGRRVEARALARRFVAAHGDSPLADRVARAAGLGAR
jgi:hypothetical protein